MGLRRKSKVENSLYVFYNSFLGWSRHHHRATKDLKKGEGVQWMKIFSVLVSFFPLLFHSEARTNRHDGKLLAEEWEVDEDSGPV
jgi:hypothetical protein